MKNKGGKIKARKGGEINVSEGVARNASKIKARTGGVINIVNPTDTVYKTDTVKVPVVRKDTVYLQRPKGRDLIPQRPDLKPIKELPYPKRTQPILEQDNTRVDMSKTKSKAEYNSLEEKNSKTFSDFFPSNINMAGTSMGSYDKPMMKGGEGVYISKSMPKFDSKDSTKTDSTNIKGKRQMPTPLPYPKNGERQMPKPFPLPKGGERQMPQFLNQKTSGLEMKCGSQVGKHMKR